MATSNLLKKPERPKSTAATARVYEVEQASIWPERH